MNRNELYEIWKKEEEVAHIKGWDFSHIHGRYEEENDLPWDYEKIVDMQFVEQLTEKTPCGESCECGQCTAE